ncbi:MAG: cytoskeletal protein RodZ [Lentimonas sp.]|jgi:cytoskeletal protein RodZ
MQKLNIGEELKRKRQELEVTIAEISESLKVNSADIEFLEKNYFHLMTKHIYLTGLIRSYCKLLKIDDEISLKYVQSLSHNSNTKNVKHKLINFNGELDRNPSKKHLLNASLIFILAFIVLMLLSSFRSPDFEIGDLIVNQFIKIKP